MATRVPKPVSDYLSKIGSKGGKARLETMTRDERSEVAALGGKARAKPTPCRKCGVMCDTAREAWTHCVNVGSRPRAGKKTAAKKAAKKKG